jgi:hypothetical protein
MTKTDKIKEKVQKLLAQANDREGTPEGDMFMSRAFELIAQYGLEGVELDPQESADAVHKSVNLSGSYTDRQAVLLHSIATALHCKSLSNRKYNSTAVASVELFGAKRHIERVEMLFSLLNPQMVAGASKLKGGDGFFETSTVVKRRSYMHGFASSVHWRLKDAENTVADNGDGEYGVMLLDDAAKAKNAMNDFLVENGFEVSMARSHSKLDSSSYMSGSSDGMNTDIGQKRFSSQLAIG